MLQIGDKNDKIEIVDADRLCYRVLSRNKGAEGVNSQDAEFKRVHDSVVNDCEVYSINPKEILGVEIVNKQPCDKETWKEIG